MTAMGRWSLPRPAGLGSSAASAGTEPEVLSQGRRQKVRLNKLALSGWGGGSGGGIWGRAAAAGENELGAGGGRTGWGVGWGREPGGGCRGGVAYLVKEFVLLFGWCSARIPPVYALVITVEREMAACLVRIGPRCSCRTAYSLLLHLLLLSCVILRGFGATLDTPS